MSVGVLALQGCVDPHLRILQKLGANATKIRSSLELSQASSLIIPGGESTTMLRLIERENMWQALLEFGKDRPVWGICAGAILIAREVLNPTQKSLSLMDIQATRNFYGSQLDSFKAEVQVPSLELKTSVDFIRAPLLKPLNNQVQVLASLNEQPVLLQQRHILASSFHIELSEEVGLHRYFVEEIALDRLSVPRSSIV